MTLRGLLARLNPFARGDRARRVRRWARARGYDWQDRAPAKPFRGGRTEDFAILRAGTGHVSRRAAHGKEPGLEFALFEHAFEAVGGRAYLVGAFKVPGRRVPRFTLVPDARFGQFKDLLRGEHDIHFADAPEFSRLFHLSGKNDASVRRFFTPAVRKALRKAPDLHVEGSDPWFLVYLPHDEPRKRDYAALLDLGRALAGGMA